jgi:outer membrane lipoprotein SlyB
MKSIIALIAAPLLLASCAQQSLTGDAYSRNEIGHAQEVRRGRIISIRYINIQGGSTAGTIVGGVAGGIIGNQIGGGTGKTLATLGGVGLGALAGSQAEKSMSSRRGLEIEVRLDGGRRIVITQEANPNEPFFEGDRVRVLSNGDRDRVIH